MMIATARKATNEENEGETDDDAGEEDTETGFVMDTRGRRQPSPIVGDLREHIN